MKVDLRSNLKLNQLLKNSEILLNFIAENTLNGFINFSDIRRSISCSPSIFFSRLHILEKYHLIEKAELRIEIHAIKTSLTKRGLRVVKLITKDKEDGIK